MKNISLILNIVLLVAVSVLFYLHFSGCKTKSPSADGMAVPSDIKIAYIQADSVLKYYDYLKDNRVQLESKSKKLEQEYRNRAQGLQNEINNYQQIAQNLTIAQARAMEEDLGKKQQNLRVYEQNLSQQLMNEEAKLNKELYDRITTFLKGYGEKNGLQLVLKLDPSSDVLYGINALDITKPVTEGLNAEYQQGKTDATGKKDSASVNK